MDPSENFTCYGHGPLLDSLCTHWENGFMASHPMWTYIYHIRCVAWYTYMHKYLYKTNRPLVSLGRLEIQSTLFLLLSIDQTLSLKELNISRDFYRWRKLCICEKIVINKETLYLWSQSPTNWLSFNKRNSLPTKGLFSKKRLSTSMTKLVLRMGLNLKANSWDLPCDVL